MTVGGHLIGGDGEDSGEIFSDSTAGAIKIGGSIIGGQGASSGGLRILGAGGAVGIGGDLVGGSRDGGTRLIESGFLKLNHVSAISIGGSVIAGYGNVDEGGSIFVFSVGSLSIKGGIVGNFTNAVKIDIGGLFNTEPGFALGALSVGGDVEFARIAVGSATSNAQINTVKVGGDWVASSLASGVDPGVGSFGDGDDTLFANVISRIASITIGGAIVGTDFTGSDSFAFTAHEIGSFKVLGKSLPLTANTFDPTVAFSPETGGDVKLREI